MVNDVATKSSLAVGGVGGGGGDYSETNNQKA